MATEPTVWREPEYFAAGDTLLFQRSLSRYLPSDGWSIQLTVTQSAANGGKQVVQVTSTPDATNSYHTFNVPNFLAGADAGTYILSEEIVNTSGEKHQIYEDSNFRVGPNLAAGTSTQAQTFAQQAIAQIQTTLLALYAQVTKETDVQRSRFVQVEIDKMRNEEAYWQERRKIEIQNERAANGKPSGNASRPFFAIGY